MSHESLTSRSARRDGLIASAARDSAVKLWRLSTAGRIQLVDEYFGHEGVVNTVCFLQDGRIASGGADNRLCVWNVKRDLDRHVLRGHTNLVRAVDISPNGRYVASGGHDYQLRIWDLEEDVSYPLEGHTAAIRAVAFSPDGEWIATGGWDSQVILWDVQRRRQVGPPFRHDLPVGDVWCSRNGNLLIALGQEFGSSGNEYTRRKTAWQIDSRTPVPINKIPAQDLVNPDLNSREGNLRLLEQSEHVGVLDVIHDEPLWLANRGLSSKFHFFPEECKTLAGIQRNDVRLLDVYTGEERARLTGHEHQIWDLAVSQDGRILVTASEDHTVRVWRTATREEVNAANW